MAALGSENWWITFRHPLDIWEKQASFLIAEIFFYLAALLTLRHAFRHGGRFPYIWLSTVLHGLTVESVSYFVPDIDNFWHAQSMIMLLGRRLPLHILLVYPMFLYTAFVSVSRMQLKKWAVPFTMGLLVILIDVPFDVMGIKLLWWTWHDTDPNVADRMYWVPWTSFYFHASFASSFNFLFHATRRLMTSTPGLRADGWHKELLCCVLVGIFSMPLGVLQFIPLYHPLHDALHLHTEVCVFLLLTVYLLVVWVADRNPDKSARTGNKVYIDEITIELVLHFVLYIVLVLVERPERVRSPGLHEQVGDCAATSPVHTALGQVLSKRSYLCVEDYDEGYFDFACSRPPGHGSEDYEICGTPYINQAEYVIVVTAFSLLALFIFSHALFYSSRPLTAVTRSKKHKSS